MNITKEEVQRLIEAFHADPQTADWDDALSLLRAKRDERDAEPIWIQPNHLEKAKMGPYLCRVEPTQRMADFVPLFTHPAHDDTALLRKALEALKQIDYDSPEDGALNQVITALRERLGEVK